MAQKKANSKKQTKQLKVKKVPLRDLQVSAKQPAVKGGRGSTFAPPYVPV